MFLNIHIWCTFGGGKKKTLSAGINALPDRYEENSRDIIDASLRIITWGVGCALLVGMTCGAVSVRFA